MKPIITQVTHRYSYDQSNGRGIRLGAIPRALIAGGLLPCLFVLGGLISSAPTAKAASYLVRSGQARAEIVIAQKPSRTTILAAHELQNYIQKIAGPELPIVHSPSEQVANKIYVGHSQYTQKLGIKNLNLKYGGFQMKSGDHWLALVGDDANWKVPVDNPAYPLTADQAKSSSSTWQAFRKLSGIKYIDYISGLNQVYKTRKHYKLNNGKSQLVWGYDKKGSLNAVNQFLRTLGVRWYMPGPLGEVVSHEDSILLPQVDKVVRPQFKMRWMQLYRSSNRWRLRMGLNMGNGTFSPLGHAHGLGPLVYSKELQKEHPEYFAMVDGKRLNHGKDAKPDLSSPGFFKLTVRYVNALFDIYDVPAVSVMPVDSYTRMPQGPLNKGKGTPERGKLGKMSDYVWDFVNRVAIEVHKTHPDKFITCQAYNTYVLPPLKIKKLSPNIIVQVKNFHGNLRDRGNVPETDRKNEQFVKSWLAKTPNTLWFSATYPLTDRGSHLPAYFTHSTPEGIAFEQKMAKGMAIEYVQEPTSRNNYMKDNPVGMDQPGFNHLNLWLASRLYWSANPVEDARKLLDEYYHKYYGPAAEQMKAFTNYSEKHWRDMGGSIPTSQREKVAGKISKVFSLLGEAQKAVKPDSIYGKRIALVAKYLEKLRQRGEQLAKPRQSSLHVRMWNIQDAHITIDGQLNEKAWKSIHGSSARALGMLNDGRRPKIKTRFKMFWKKDHLYIGIRCEDPDMDHVRAAVKLAKSNPQKHPISLFSRSRVEILIETQAHSYYHMAVGPAGKLVDVDGKNRFNWWSSKADVATHLDKDSWTVEMRIPCTGTTTSDDPRHIMIGTKPTETFPWFFNICRERVRDSGTQAYAFSPTHGHGFNAPQAFAKLYSN